MKIFNVIQNSVERIERRWIFGRDFERGWKFWTMLKIFNVVQFWTRKTNRVMEFKVVPMLVEYCNEWSKPQTWPWKCSPFSTNIKKWLGMKVCFRSTFNGQATPFKVAAAFEWTSNWGQMSIHLLWSMKCHNYRDLVFSMLSYSNYTLPAVKIDSLWIHLFLSLFIFPILEGNYNFNFPIHYCKVPALLTQWFFHF